MEKEIIIKPHFIFKDYFKLNLYLFIFSLYGLLSLIIILLLVTYYFYYYEIGLFSLTDFTLILVEFLLIIPIIILFTNYIKTKRSLADPRLKEEIIFKINKSDFIDIGQSYSRKFNFSEMLKITETKNFFLFYITKHMVKVIRKSDLKDNQFNKLKALFNSLDVKKSLK